METIKATSETIMCTLSAAELKDVSAAWQRLFREWLVSRELVPGGIRMTVVATAEPALRQLIEIEIECCTWITFEFDGPSVKLTAEGEGEQAIREMWADPGGVAGSQPT
jgi:predicted transcriptional regulator YdeE